MICWTMDGTIITFGIYAATIQIDTGQQFYAPYNELSIFVIADLMQETSPYDATSLDVIFNVDETRWSGESLGVKRYYATNVELKNIIKL